MPKGSLSITLPLFHSWSCPIEYKKQVREYREREKENGGKKLKTER
jgi:hypothetical protein